MSLLTSLKGLINKTRSTIADIISPTPESRYLEKWEIFAFFLRQYKIVSILVDTSIPGVLLPEHLMTGEKIHLQYGLNLVRPIPDLNVGSDGVSATLSFNRKEFKTYIPWNAVLNIQIGSPPPINPGGGSPNLLVIKGGKSVANDKKEERMAA